MVGYIKNPGLGPGFYSMVRQSARNIYDVLSSAADPSKPPIYQG